MGNVVVVGAGLAGLAAPDTRPAKVTLDTSPPSGTPGVMMGFIDGEQARPEHYVERDWMAEEFTRGCCGAHFAPGSLASYGEAWRAPIGRIHRAGTECASAWNGYLEGAARSGQAAAEAVAELQLAGQFTDVAIPRQPEPRQPNGVTA